MEPGFASCNQFIGFPRCLELWSSLRLVNLDLASWTPTARTASNKCSLGNADGCPSPPRRTPRSRERNESQHGDP